MPPAIALAKKPSGPPRTPKPMMTANPTARMAHGTARTSSLPRGHRISSLVLGGTLSNVRGSPGDGGNHRGFGFRWGGTCDGEGNPSLDGLNLLCGAWVPGRECDRVPLSLGLALRVFPAKDARSGKPRSRTPAGASCYWAALLYPTAAADSHSAGLSC
jgi:hypothetical protein